jgi:predicted outer membrane repeat protein
MGFGSSIKQLQALGNQALNGGFLSLQSRDLFFKGAELIEISSNMAAGAQGKGGAFNIAQATMSYEQISTLTFVNNSAMQDGGAIYIEQGSISFINNYFVEFKGNSASGAANDIYMLSSIMNIITNNTAQKANI